MVVSVLFSVALHLAILAASPRIPMLRPYEIAARETPRFHVDLVVVPTPPETASNAERTGLASRPGSVRDLLKRETDLATPSETLIHPEADLARLKERLALERAFPQESTEPNEALLREIDTRIVEISQNEMRRNIEVARRLVAPSATRILDEGETPVLRGTSDLEYEETIVFPTQMGAPVEPVRVPVTSGDMTESSRLQESLSPLDVAEEPPSLIQLEKEVARAPMVQTMQASQQKYDFLDDLVTVSLEKYVPPNESHGYFRLVIAPKKDADLSPLPKDVTFVVDASSSITQRKLDRTVAGILTALRGLRDDDRFNIVVFRDNPTLFAPSPIPATPENKRNGENFLKGIQSRGQTNVYDGIRPVIEMSPREGIPGIVIVSTDGRPTTGIVDARNVINALTESNQRRNSIFAFAGGSTANRYLLDLLAYRNKGESYVAQNIDQMPNDFLKFIQRISDPILVDCEVDFGRLDEGEVFPKEIPDFFKGQAVTVYGRFDPKNDCEFAMRLVGKAGDKKKEIVFKQDFAQAATGDERIARTWAFRRIYHLIGEVCRVGETPELLNEIRALSRKYNIRTVYD